jgi:hypothetical protein
MRQLDINIQNHRRTFSDEARDGIYSIIRSTLTHAELHSFTMYLFDGQGSSIHAGGQNDLVVLAHHPEMRIWDNVKETRIVVNDVYVAQYFESINHRQSSYQQFIIFDDLFTDFNEENARIFTAIMQQLDNIYLQKNLFYSWKQTPDKDALTKQFQEQVRKQQETFLENDKSALTNAEYKLKEYMGYIKSYSDKRIRLQTQIAAHSERIGKVAERLIIDLDNIANHPKVKDFYIKDNIFEIHTEPIYAYHDVTGERYYIGNMTIKLDPMNTSVHFYGDNPRKSYWSSADPHPHVSGRSHEACLGNISGTIAELCSQMEIYALTLVCIDFLESVNTSDTAGKNIVNWDRVDKEGNIIPRDIPKWICPSCETEYIEENVERVIVYDCADADDYWESSYVCRSCTDEHYRYSDHHDEFIYNESDYWDLELED